MEIHARKDGLDIKTDPVSNHYKTKQNKKDKRERMHSFWDILKKYHIAPSTQTMGIKWPP